MNQQSTSTDLGNQVAVFHGRPIDIPTWVLLFFPSALAIFALYLYGIYLAITTYQQHGPALAVARSQTWLILATVLLIITAAYLVYRILYAWTRIVVFEAGLIVRSFFLRSKTYPWTEISGISSSATELTFFRKSIKTTPSARLYLAAGQSFNLSGGFQGLPKLIKIVKSKLYPMIWPRIKSNIRAARDTQFGKITIGRSGMHIARKSIPWASIVRINTKAGYLVVELHDNSIIKESAINIPNLELLLEAIEWGFSK